MKSKQVSGFQWDDGNREKCQKHGASIQAIESIFMRPVAILPDESHSDEEKRYRAIGATAEGRYVFLVFTLRSDEDNLLIRPISARYMHQKEVDAYEKANSSI